MSAADPKASVQKMCKLFCIVVLDVCVGGGGGGGEESSLNLCVLKCPCSTLFSV